MCVSKQMLFPLQIISRHVDDSVVVGAPSPLALCARRALPPPPLVPTWLDPASLRGGLVQEVISWPPLANLCYGTLAVNSEIDVHRNKGYVCLRRLPAGGLAD